MVIMGMVIGGISMNSAKFVWVLVTTVMVVVVIDIDFVMIMSWLMDVAFVGWAEVCHVARVVKSSFLAHVITVMFVLSGLNGRADGYKDCCCENLHADFLLGCVIK